MPPDPIPEEPTPEVIDLIKEIASMVFKSMKGMQEITFTTLVFVNRSPVRMTITMETIN